MDRKCAPLGCNDDVFVTLRIEVVNKQTKHISIFCFDIHITYNYQWYNIQCLVSYHCISIVSCSANFYPDSLTDSSPLLSPISYNSSPHVTLEHNCPDLFHTG